MRAKIVYPERKTANLIGESSAPMRYTFCKCAGGDAVRMDSYLFLNAMTNHHQCVVFHTHRLTFFRFIFQKNQKKNQNLEIFESGESVCVCEREREREREEIFKKR